MNTTLLWLQMQKMSIVSSKMKFVPRFHLHGMGDSTTNIWYNRNSTYHYDDTKELLNDNVTWFEMDGVTKYDVDEK